MLEERDIGETVSVTILRDGRRRTIQVALRQRPLKLTAAGSKALHALIRRENTPFVITRRGSETAQLDGAQHGANRLIISGGTQPGAGLSSTCGHSLVGVSQAVL